MSLKASKVSTALDFVLLVSRTMTDWILFFFFFGFGFGFGFGVCVFVF